MAYGILHSGNYVCGLSTEIIRTANGWKFCAHWNINWNDGSTAWEPLKHLKEAYYKTRIILVVWRKLTNIGLKNQEQYKRHTKLIMRLVPISDIRQSSRRWRIMQWHSDSWRKENMYHQDVLWCQVRFDQKSLICCGGTQDGSPNTIDWLLYC